MRLVGCLLPGRKIFLSCIFQRDPTDKKRAGRATDRVGAGARDHTADHIAPAWEKFQDRPSPLTEKHSCANICPDGRHKFRRSAQASFSTADIHDAGDHHHLERSENRQVCQRNGLRSDCRANGSRRFYQHLCDVMLRFAITRNSNHLDLCLIRKLLYQN